MRPFRYQLGAVALATCLLGGTGAPSAAAAGNDAVEEVKSTVMYHRTPHDRLFDIEFVGSRGWAVGDFGLVMRTDDGGTTWKELVAVESDSLLGVDFIDDKRGVVVGTMGAAYYTEDGGDSWSKAETDFDGRLFNAKLSASGFGFGVGEFGAMVRTDDLGHSWKNVSPSYEELLNQMEEPHLYDLVIDSTGAVTVFGEFNTILRSRDRGDTWEILRKGDSLALETKEGDTIGAESMFSVYYIDDNRGWTCGQSGLILTTQDGGDTWSKQATPTESLLMDIWMSREGEGVAIGMRTLLRTKDFGKTWYALQGKPISDRWFQALAKGEAMLHIESKLNADGEKTTPSMTTISNPVYAVGVGGLIIRLD